MRSGRRDGEFADEIAVKLNPQKIAFLPEPRPMFEIFVCSPMVEGVHLRGGRVARGGLRWSDRPEDFRTEVLGLVKAQMVKNAVIVPVGAKGGFVIKSSTASPADRDAVRAEGVDRYRRFIRSLLDVTDNLDGADVVHPADCVIYDDDDPYLVVAADKGTATFSDIANELAIDAGFWLGDAFAIGRQRRLRPQGDGHHRPRRVGERAAPRPGDRQGRRHRRADRRRHRRHVRRRVRQRHVVVDTPAAWSRRSTTATSSSTRTPTPPSRIAERARLFELPRSSWDDYDSRADLGGWRGAPALGEVDRPSPTRCGTRSASTTR